MYILKIVIITTLLLQITYAFTIPEIIISEIYRDPFGAESSIGGGLSHEFVELTNLSRKTVSLTNVFITDGNDCDSIVPWISPIPGHEDCIYNKTELLPGQSALILDPDYPAAIKQNSLNRLPIAANTLILSINDKDLGNGLSSDDGLLLFKGTKSRIDTLYFCAADSLYESLQVPVSKVVLSNPANKEGLSVVPSALMRKLVFELCTKGFTPGVYEYMQGAWYAEWETRDVSPVTNTFTAIIMTLYTGTEETLVIPWALFADGMNVKRSALEIVNGFGSVTVINLAQNRTNIFEIDNKYTWNLYNSALVNDKSVIKASEINCRAAPDEPEWFEIVNKSKEDIINIQGYLFGNSESIFLMTNVKKLIMPNEYVVITKDSLQLRKKYPYLHTIIQPPVWHTLDNYKDTLLLLNADSLIIENCAYDSKMFKSWENQSIARTAFGTDSSGPQYWRIQDESNPGLPDFLSVKKVDKMTIGPIPFTPDNDGKDEFCAIYLPFTSAALLSLSIYGFDGKKLKTINIGNATEFFWNGKKDNNQYAPSGPFFVVAEYEKGNKKFKMRCRGILWR
jgi:hypothetical protein